MLYEEQLDKSHWVHDLMEWVTVRGGLAVLWKQWVESHKERGHVPLWTVSLHAVCSMQGLHVLCASWVRKAGSAVCKRTSEIWFPASYKQPHPFSLPLPTECSRGILSTRGTQHTQLPAGHPLLRNGFYSMTLIHMAASFLFPQSPLLYDFSIKTFPSALKPILLSYFLFGRHVKYLVELHQWLLHDCPSSSEW